MQLLTGQHVPCTEYETCDECIGGFDCVWCPDPPVSFFEYDDPAPIDTCTHFLVTKLYMLMLHSIITGHRICSQMYAL